MMFPFFSFAAVINLTVTLLVKTEDLSFKGYLAYEILALSAVNLSTDESRPKRERGSESLAAGDAEDDVREPPRKGRDGTQSFGLPEESSRTT